MITMLRSVIAASLLTATVYPQAAFEARFIGYFGNEIIQSFQQHWAGGYDYLRPGAKALLSEQGYARYAEFKISPSDVSQSIKDAQQRIKEGLARSRTIIRGVAPAIVKFDKSVRSGGTRTVHFSVANEMLAVIGGVTEQLKGVEPLSKVKVEEATKKVLKGMAGLTWTSQTSEGWLEEKGEWYLAEPTLEEARTMQAEAQIIEKIDALNHPADRAKIAGLCAEILKINPGNEEAKRYYDRSQEVLAFERGLTAREEKGKLQARIDKNQFLDYPLALSLYKDYTAKYPEDTQMSAAFPAWKAVFEKAWKKGHLKKQVDAGAALAEIEAYIKLCNEYIALEPDDSWTVELIGNNLYEMVNGDRIEGLTEKADRALRQTAIDYYIKLNPEATDWKDRFKYHYRKIYGKN